MTPLSSTAPPPGKTRASEAGGAPALEFPHRSSNMKAVVGAGANMPMSSIKRLAREPVSGR